MVYNEPRLKWQKIVYYYISTYSQRKLQPEVEQISETISSLSSL